MDSFGAISLAKIRILLLPIGDPPKSVFDKWADEIRQFEEIKHSDIPGDNRDERGDTCIDSRDDYH